jgi:hypothetical protein
VNWSQAPGAKLFRDAWGIIGTALEATAQAVKDGQPRGLRPLAPEGIDDDALGYATDAYDMMTPDDPIADREGMRRAIQEYLLRVGRAPAPPPTPEGTA